MTGLQHPSRGNLGLRPVDLHDLDSIHGLLLRAPGWFNRDELSQSILARRWERSGFELANDARVATTNAGEVVGYVDFWDRLAPHTRHDVLATVHPNWLEMGIGTRLLDWALARSRVSLAKTPAGLEIRMRQGVVADDEPGHAFLAANGFDVVRHFFRMGIILDQAIESPSWPCDVRVKTFDRSSDLERLIRAMQDASIDHWGHVPAPFEKEWELWNRDIGADPYHDPSLWFLASSGQEVLGACLCSTRTTQTGIGGWIGDVGVRRDSRRRGIGLALLLHALRELQSRGCGEAGLRVDAGSLTGATRLYERAGMKRIRRFDIYELVVREGRDLRQLGTG